MRKQFILFATAAMIFAGGCSDEYDDSVLNGRVDNLEQRVAKLEELCRQMNTNISSLQTIVTALQNNDYVTGVTPVTENGQEIGYTLTFSKSGPIVIYHGKNGKDGANGADGKDGINGTDGKDGHTPVIGVRQDTDGIYYWTLDGEWLLDGSGNKIKAEGRDGKDGADGENGQDGADGQPGANGQDGITPQLKIEEGYWYISYDNGATWTNLGKATGENGADATAGESFFKDVSQDDNYIYLTLSTDEQIAIPKHHPLSITFDKTDEISVQTRQTYSIGYTLTGADEHTVVKALAQDGFRAVVKKTDNTTGAIEITTPAVIRPSEVLVFVSDGEERTIMRSINFVEGVIVITTKSYTVGTDGGTVEIDLSTNFDYTVKIPEADQAWISVAKIESRAAMRDETITLNVAANSTPAARHSEIRLVDEFGVTGETMLISQEAGPDNTGIVSFTDDIFKEYMVANFDLNQDGEISQYEASVITEINCSSKLIQSLEGIEYCTALTWLECGNNQLTTLDVSKHTALKTLECGGNPLTTLDVSNNTKLEGLDCSENQLTTLDVSNNTKLYWLYCTSNQLTALDMSKNTALTKLVCGNNQLTTLDVSGCSALKELECYNNQLPALDVSGCSALKELYCSGNPLEVLNLGEVNPERHDPYHDFLLSISNGVPSLKVIGTKLTYLKVSSLQSLDVSECPALTTLDCHWNQLTTLDVSKNTALTTLDCGHNQLTVLDISNNTLLTKLVCYSNQLTALDVSSHTRLGELSCGNNQLTTLDVSNNTRLTSLLCQANQLTALDLSKNTALTRLECDNNQLTTLDVSKNTALTSLKCSNNPLEVLTLGEVNLSLSLGLGSSTKLKVIGSKVTELDVSSNQLQSLDVSECPALTKLGCRSNQLTTLDVSQTNLGNSTEYYPLICGNMPTLQTLYLKTGWEINKINVNRDSYYIPSQTQILYKD